MTTPTEPSVAATEPDPSGPRVLLRDVIVTLFLLAGAGLIVAAVGLLSDYRWAMLAGGILLAVLGFRLDDPFRQREE